MADPDWARAAAISNIVLAVVTALGLFVSLRQSQQIARQWRADKEWEISEAVYVPLRVDLQLGAVRSRPSAPELYGWRELKLKAFHLTSRVPADLRAGLDRLEQLSQDAHELREEVRRMVASHIEDLAEPLKAAAGRTGARATDFQLWVQAGGGGEPDPVVLWASGWTLRKHVEATVARYPRSRWELKVRAGGFDIGKQEAAYELADKLFALLEADPAAQNLRAKTSEIIDLSESLLRRVEARMEQPP